MMLESHHCYEFELGDNILDVMGYYFIEVGIEQ